VTFSFLSDTAVPIYLFQNIQVTTLMLGGFAVNAVMFGVTFGSALYFQRVLSYSDLRRVHQLQDSLKLHSAPETRAPRGNRRLPRASISRKCGSYRPVKRRIFRRSASCLRNSRTPLPRSARNGSSSTMSFDIRSNLNTRKSWRSSHQAPNNHTGP